MIFIRADFCPDPVLKVAASIKAMNLFYKGEVKNKDVRKPRKTDTSNQDRAVENIKGCRFKTKTLCC